MLLAAATAAALAPAPPDAVPDFNDKLAHALGFGVLTLWFAGARNAGLVRLGCWLAAYGAGIELAQGLTPTRSPELADLAADVAGILVALLLASLGLRGWWSRVRSARAGEAGRG